MKTIYEMNKVEVVDEIALIELQLKNDPSLIHDIDSSDRYQELQYALEFLFL